MGYHSAVALVRGRVEVFSQWSALEIHPGRRLEQCCTRSPILANIKDTRRFRASTMRACAGLNMRLSFTVPPGFKLRLLRLARTAGKSLSTYVVEILEHAMRSEPPVPARQLWRRKRAAQARDRELAEQGQLTNQQAVFIPVSHIRGSIFHVPEGARPLTAEDVRKDEDEG